VDARKRLSLYHYSAGDHEGALDVLRTLREVAPEDSEVLENTGVILRLLHRREEAIECLLEAHRRAPERANVCDALAHCYANLGDGENARRFGARSLELKDAEAAARELPWSLPGGGPPPFAADDPKANVIAFSLWGDDPRYLRGAVRNAVAAMDVYSAWTCRFYVDDSVPAEVVATLERYGAEIERRPRPASFFDGLMWRFEVIDDPNVSRFLVRDCDSVVSVKERVAVDEWLASDRWFHAMRDFASHTEVLLAGMWGGATGALPGVAELRRRFRPGKAPTRTFDQVFLRECVWPLVRGSVLVHDSVYTGCLGSVPFPSVGGLPPRHHVGQNEAAVRPGVPVDLPERLTTGEGASAPGIVIASGLDREALDFVVAVLGGVEALAEPRRIDAGALRDRVAELGAALGTAGSKRAPEVVAACLGAPDRGKAGGDERSFLVEAAGDIGWTGDLLARGEAKLLGVIRDPRETARARGIADEAGARELTQRWNEHLRVIARANRRHPGAVEIVRYEDAFDAAKRETLRRRLASFLGLSLPPWPAPPEMDGGPPLPEAMRSAIEGEAGDRMAKLRYAVTGSKGQGDG